MGLFDFAKHIGKQLFGKDADLIFPGQKIRIPLAPE